MRENIFGKVYASLYDILYRDKDYEAECDFLETIFRKLDIPVKTILDLGCGTGGHAIPLARRGYKVTGVDWSKEMLSIGRQNAIEVAADVEFVYGDIRDVDLGQTFDAVISMFAVMSYQATNADLAAACSTARRHLTSAGIFTFDSWHGPGVLIDPPTQRVKIVQDDTQRIVRFTQPKLDVMDHIVETHFKTWVSKGDRILSEVDETHLMRFLFPREIAYYLQVAGFDSVEFCPFLELDGQLQSDCWNISVMATMKRK